MASIELFCLKNGDIGTMLGTKDESLNDWLFGCALYTLDKFSDERGCTVPVLSLTEHDMPYIEQYAYYSITQPGAARDDDRWHVHQGHTDRFVVVHGYLMFAVSDGNRTVRITLYGRYPRMLIVPPGVYHCLRNTHDKPSILLNLPDRIYDPSDEGRVPFGDLKAEHPW